MKCKSNVEIVRGDDKIYKPWTIGMDIIKSMILNAGDDIIVPSGLISSEVEIILSVDTYRRNGLGCIRVGKYAETWQRIVATSTTFIFTADFEKRIK